MGRVKGVGLFTLYERENPDIKLNDGTHKIFLCAGGIEDDCSDKMKDFLDYIADQKINGELSRRLQDEVSKSKKREEWRADYMTLLEHYQERYEEGLKDGQKNIEIERKRADVAETRANNAEARANDAETRANTAEAELERYKKKYGSL